MARPEPQSAFRRRLTVERLEDRRLLAITVNTLVDEADGNILDGDVSLRDAIAAAPAGETIDFAVTGTILLTQELVIDKPLTISGPGGQAVQLSGNNTHRVLRIDDNNANIDIPVRLIGFTIRNGRALVGSGIMSLEDLTIQSCRVVDNLAFDSSGGGGIVASGPLTIESSTIANNRSAIGGAGLVAAERLLVLRSTISDNVVSNGPLSKGGGILVVNCGEEVLIQSSTIASNTAQHGAGLWIASFGGRAKILHSTISDVVRIEAGDLLLDHSVVSPAVQAMGHVDRYNSIDGDQLYHGGDGQIVVAVELAAMGDFEAGPTGDRILFEYSIAGGPYQSLLTGAVAESESQTYTLDSGNEATLDDPLSVNGVTLTNTFKTVTAVIPVSGPQIRIRFTTTMDGAGEAFAWRNMRLSHYGASTPFGRAVSSLAGTAGPSAIDPDETVIGDMFGIRSRLTPGPQGLPFDIADDSAGSFPADMQGIVKASDTAPFFGVVDTVNGSGNDTNSAVWTFANPTSPVTVAVNFGPLQNNGGPTRTRETYPALNAGRSAAIAGINGVPIADQRGAPYARVGGGRIDIGALESQSTLLPLSSDFNGDGHVNGTDFVIWQRFLGTTSNVTLAQGDSNYDGMIDSLDLANWRDAFATVTTVAATAPGVLANELSKDTASDSSGQLPNEARVPRSRGAQPANIQVLPTDFNFDGTIDCLDLAIWKANLGATNASQGEGDANGNGVVDVGDLLHFAEYFGLTSFGLPALVPFGARPESLATTPTEHNCGCSSREVPFAVADDVPEPLEDGITLQAETICTARDAALERFSSHKQANAFRAHSKVREFAADVVVSPPGETVHPQTKRLPTASTSDAGDQEPDQELEFMPRIDAASTNWGLFDARDGLRG